jgi:hypothetical protein
MRKAKVMAVAMAVAAPVMVAYADGAWASRCSGLHSRSCGNSTLGCGFRAYAYLANSS